VSSFFGDSNDGAIAQRHGSEEARSPERSQIRRGSEAIEKSHNSAPWCTRKYASRDNGGDSVANHSFVTYTVHKVPSTRAPRLLYHANSGVIFIKTNSHAAIKVLAGRLNFRIQKCLWISAMETAGRALRGS
jgi:hypothetical protein